jgi:hypothetical protein
LKKGKKEKKKRKRNGMDAGKDIVDTKCGTTCERQKNAEPDAR